MAIVTDNMLMSASVSDTFTKLMLDRLHAEQDVPCIVYETGTKNLFQH